MYLGIHVNESVSVCIGIQIVLYCLIFDIFYHHHTGRPGVACVPPWKWQHRMVASLLACKYNLPHLSVTPTELHTTLTAMLPAQVCIVIRDT